MSELRLIVPAAGVGSRMMLLYPKTMYRIMGKPILGHILDVVKDLIDEAIIIVSCTGEAAIQQYLQSRGDLSIRTSVQTKPIGMADAIQVGLRAFDEITPGDYLIIWGDQVTVRREVIEQIIVHHQATNAWLTFPTSWRESPYIHIKRDAYGRVSGILEAREGDPMPLEGENDCGIFLARGEVLSQGLQDLRAKTFDPTTHRFRRLNGRVSITGEFNFLPLVELWVLNGHPVEAIKIGKVEDTIGVNTKAEASIIEQMDSFKLLGV